jgi:signal transduction histidine kinase
LRIAPESIEPAAASGAGVQLNDLLAAWHDATNRLEQTHRVLQGEVCRLTDELEAKNRELARKNRLADLGQMASHIAHEVKNSLVPITLYLDLLQRRCADDPQGLTILAKVEAGFQSLNNTVNDLLSFAAHRQPQPQSFVVGSLVDELVESLEPQMLAQAVDIEIDIPPQTIMRADREMVRRAVLNLLLNALDAMPRGGSIVVTSFESRRGFEIEIADSGPGVSGEQRKRMFEPFYSTKESGTGLGLAMVQHVAEAHGGRVDVRNCPEGGAAFTLFFPRPAYRMAA